MFEKVLTTENLFDIIIVQRTNVPNIKSNKQTLLMKWRRIMNTSAYPVTNRELLNFRKKMRRQRILRKRITLMILALFLTFILSISYNVLVTQANEDITDVSYKYYTYHEVIKGETLWSIAEIYIDYDFYDSIPDYIEELKVMNRLTDDVIKVGEEILVTYYSAEYY